MKYTRFAWLGTVIVTVAFSVGCTVPNPATDAPSASVQADRGAECRRFDSFSGRFIVGDPPESTPGLVPVPADGVVPGVAVPILGSVVVRTSISGTVITYPVSGDGQVGWTARFVQAPLLRGTSDTVGVSGRCLLQLDLTGVDSNGADYASERPMLSKPDGDSSVVEVLTYQSSDSLLQSFVGMRGGDPNVTVSATRSPEAISVSVSS
ncbi:AMIN-like domain-containing (lipo)protein [Rhodococcus sp. NBC_00297]|uniref:AMIN-like domain-containing (lipo)protein n=1 Tax=Rhodococcus sp. NBC_00297 TaxID=2976005 RepID=UPI002E297195|nr:hypothetical protein [Rhodococcus sp. NBC_00297]